MGAAHINVRHLRDDTQGYGAALERQGARVFNAWLDALKI